MATHTLTENVALYWVLEIGRIYGSETVEAVAWKKTLKCSIASVHIKLKTIIMHTAKR